MKRRKRRPRKYSPRPELKRSTISPAAIRRGLLGLALLFGVVGILIGGLYLAEGEFTISQGWKSWKTHGAWKSSVIGHVQSDDLLFYPIAVGWIVAGATSVVAAPVALITGSRALGRAAAAGAAGFVLMTFSTFGVAAWYGDAPARTGSPAPAAAPTKAAPTAARAAD